MIASMAEPKKPKRGKGRPKGRRPTVVLQARVSPEMSEAFERLLQQTRRPKNTELIIALENHLKAAGFWPPPADATPGKGE